MKKYLIPMHFAGMDFMLDADINVDGDYEGLFKVLIWNNNDKLYHEVSFEVQEFENVLKDQIYEAVETWKLNNRLAAEDLIYDSARGN
jgi:hypothetical protein